MLKYFAVRKHDKMKEVLKNHDAVGPDVYYYMIRGGKDKTNITVWETGTVDGEYIKTYGHYHIGDIDEIYRIVRGRGIILLQKRKTDQNGNPIDNEIEIFLAIKVYAGDSIYIPSKVGHLAVNTGDTRLVTIDNTPVNLDDPVDFHSHADFEPIRRMHGFAYYVVEKDGKPELIKNTNYIRIPEPRWLTVAECQKRCLQFNIVRSPPPLVGERNRAWRELRSAAPMQRSEPTSEPTKSALQ